MKYDSVILRSSVQDCSYGRSLPPRCIVDLTPLISRSMPRWCSFLSASLLKDMLTFLIVAGDFLIYQAVVQELDPQVAEFGDSFFLSVDNGHL